MADRFRAGDQIVKLSEKIFVAGGTGMVGSAVIRRLVAEGYGDIVANYHQRRPDETLFMFSSDVPVHRDGSGYTFTLSSGSKVCFIPADLTRQSDTEVLFERERPDYVFLAAARVGGILANSIYRAEFIYQNLMIEANVIEAAHMAHVKKLLFLGSSCIYPKLASQPMGEEELLAGPLESTNEPYAVAKIAGIKLCESYHRQYGDDFISAMPTNLFGPNDNYDLESSHVLPALIRKFHLAKLLSLRDYAGIRRDFMLWGSNTVQTGKGPLSVGNNSSDEDLRTVLDSYGISLTGGPGENGIAVSLWGTGTPRREFLYVDDLGSAALHLMRVCEAEDLLSQGISHINVGTGEDLTIRELAELVRSVVGFSCDIQFDHTKPDGTPRKLLDIKRIEGYGWRPDTGIREGIARAYSLYRERRGNRI